MTESRGSWVSLSSAELAAQIDPLGAQLSILRDRRGRDLLWNGEPSIWASRAPLLFPIVGTLAGGSYRLGTKSFHLPRHGFARGKVFEVITVTQSTAIFSLRADESTLQIYPFRFELVVEYALGGATLTVTASVRNAGDEPMTASFGFHPGFRWPLPYGQPRLAHYLEFATDEPAPIRRLNGEGLVRPESFPTPIAQRRLQLEDALFQSDVIIFDRIRSRRVTYGAEAGPRIEVSYPDAPYLGVWTKPGADLLCIEPWHGLADPVDFAGEFAAKPGVFCLAPEATQSMQMAITLLGEP